MIQPIARARSLGPDFPPILALLGLAEGCRPKWYVVSSLAQSFRPGQLEAARKGATGAADG